MDKIKLLYFSDFDPRGSGYSQISVNLCKGLAERGYDIKLIALSYENQEHDYPFSALPVRDLQEFFATTHNLVQMWTPDAIVVAMDLPWQEKIVQQLQKYNLPYIGIMPLESDPLCDSWAMTLLGMKKVLFMSEFGANEARKQHIQAEHLRLGVDTESWRMPSPEEKKALRSAILGIDDDETFIILTVADNQERKNLSAAMQMVSKFRKEVTDNFRYVLVTRPNLPIGWRLRDLANDLAISDRYIEFDKARQGGISFRELWGLYACADCFLLTSKGEGFGFPIVEAMSVGVPVIATETGACIEHVTQGGGWLLEPAFVHIDPYGNANRYYVDIDDGVAALTAVHSGLDCTAAVKAARAYVESRDWETPVAHLDQAIRESIGSKEMVAVL